MKSLLEAALVVVCLVIGVAQGSRAQVQVRPTATRPPVADLRGTDKQPLSVKILPIRKTDEEIAQETKDRADTSSANWSMVKLTGIIGLIGLLQLVVFGLQARRLRQTIDKMEEIAKGQTADMRASIGEATRAASAMEGVAQSLEVSTASNAASVSISREIADRQKLVTELGSRAYLSVVFNAAAYQDADHRFEGQIVVGNRGNTPAYDVTVKATVGIVQSPIPDDFEFPLTDRDLSGSVSFIAPGLSKMITRAFRDRVAEADVAGIKSGAGPRCFAMWGIVDYKDAFNEPRFVKFAFSMSWLDWAPGKGKDKDGNVLPPQSMSYDTARHNEAT